MKPFILWRSNLNAQVNRINLLPKHLNYEMETITNNVRYFLMHCETNAENLWKCNGTFEASSHKGWLQSIPRSIDGAGYGGSDLEIIAWLISEPGGFDGLLKIHELQSLYWGYVLSEGTSLYTSTHSKPLCPIFSLRILHICFVCHLQMCDWSWHLLLIRRAVVSLYNASRFNWSTFESNQVRK